MTLRGRQVFDPVGEPQGPPVQVRVRPPQPIPWVSGGVVVIAVAVWVLDVLFLHHRIGLAGALFGPRVAHGDWWRVITAVFVHAEPDLIRSWNPTAISSGLTEGLLHIGFNMWVVVSLGFVFERQIGSKRMLLVSLICALGASAFSLAFNFRIFTIGASGMILGWAGALLPLLTREGQRQIGLWLVEIAVISILPGVSWAGHLGGFLFGLPCGVALRKGPKFWPAAGVLLVAAVLVCVFAVQAHVPRLP